jgi:hypothetical protein
LLNRLISGKKHLNFEKISLFTLTGILMIINNKRAQRLRKIITRELTGIDFLHDEIQEALKNKRLGFISAFFALYGMGLVRNPKYNFTSGANHALRESYLDFRRTTRAADIIFQHFVKIVEYNNKHF